MTRFTKIYQERKKERSKLIKKNGLNKEGYGYIKRRVGILPSELKLPTYNSVGELSDYISQKNFKSWQ